MYRRTREQIDGHPCFASAAGQHLFRHPEDDKWHLSFKPFDPADPFCVASISAAGGPVPTGARAWWVYDGGKWVEHEVTAREVDAAAAAALEVERAAAEAARAAAAVEQLKRVVRSPPPPPPAP